MLSSKQRHLIDDLLSIADPQERLSVVLIQGSRHQLQPDEKKHDNLVPGCVSKVWVVGGVVDGLCRFRCDAESPMVKGLVALLCDLYSDTTPEEVVAVEPEVWQECGFDRLLSPTRLNGLKGVRARIVQLARHACQPPVSPSPP